MLVEGLRAFPVMPTGVEGLSGDSAVAMAQVCVLGLSAATSLPGTQASWCSAED